MQALEFQPHGPQDDIGCTNGTTIRYQRTCVSLDDCFYQSRNVKLPTSQLSHSCILDLHDFFKLDDGREGARHT